jgi:hypothetical protein
VSQGFSVNQRLLTAPLNVLVLFWYNSSVVEMLVKKKKEEKRENYKK